VYSIASLFDTNQSGTWQKISDLCNLSGMTTHSIPHFSWQTADSYQTEPLNSELQLLLKTISPFSFTTSGLGIFNNERKILFLIIVKTRVLLEIHESLWNHLTRFANNPRLYYSPTNWIPHISINLNKLNDEQFKWSLSTLLKSNLNFEFEVKKFGIIYLEQGSSGIEADFPLKGKGVS
jgi:2'-5' RNA ligase